MNESVKCGIQVKANKSCLYKAAVPSFESVDKILSVKVYIIKMWPLKGNFLTVLFCSAVYYSVQCGLTFESVDRILKCDNSNQALTLSCGAVYYAVQGGCRF